MKTPTFSNTRTIVTSNSPPSNNSVYKFGPLISILYLVSHVYTFMYILNWWNNFDMLTMIFSALHIPVPLYTMALSYY